MNDAAKPKKIAISLLFSTLVALLSACADYEFRVNERVVYTPLPLFSDFTVSDAALHNCLVQTIEDLNVGIMVRNVFGQDVYGTTTWKHDKRVSLTAGERCLFSFLLDMNLGVGKYTVSIALSAGDNHLESCLEWRDHAASFEILSTDNNDFLGLCRLDPIIQVCQLRD